MAKIRSKTLVRPEFNDIKRWYNSNLHPDANDYDDPDVYRHVYHEGRFAGVFQATSKGAQRFFMKAKPENIVDIAALTSIYRPGPLSAEVDKLWLKHKDIPYDWGHPLINECLKDTRSLLVFQEQVMKLAEEIGGFPKDQCDNVRRAIMKRDHSKGEQAKKDAAAMEDAYVAGAVKKGIPEPIARKSYQTLLWFSGYGFNLAHATAYAIDSYQCAYLLTHHKEQWLCAYLESMSSNDDKRAKAFSEVRSMGYQIVPVDINDAGLSWKALPGKRLMPSLTSCKGVGASAIEELEQFRPFSSIEELLWDEDGKWRPSKFNKRALEALINVQAFESLGEVGPDKLFTNYAHMHKVVIEHNPEIKRSTKKDPLQGKKRFFELVKEHRETPDWTRREKAQHIIKHFGTLDINQLVPKSVIDRLEQKGVASIDEYTHKDVHWFCVMKSTPKTTKNGRKYMHLEVTGLASKTYKMFMWSWDGKTRFDDYTMMLGEISKNEYGFTTSQGKLRVIEL